MLCCNPGAEQILQHLLKPIETRYAYLVSTSPLPPRAHPSTTHTQPTALLLRAEISCHHPKDQRGPILIRPTHHPRWQKKKVRLLKRRR